jgi:DNA-binding LytR/AlgR family response regulator
MSLTYIIIDDDQQSVMKTKSLADRFQNLSFIASAINYDDGVNLILQHQPKLVFLEINPLDKNSNLSLQLINELYRFLREVPKIIVTTTTKELAFEAMKYEVVDYMLKPLNINDFRKATLKLTRDLVFSNQLPIGSLEKSFETHIEQIVVPKTENVEAAIPSVEIEENVIHTVDEVPVTEEFTTNEEIIESIIVENDELSSEDTNGEVLTNSDDTVVTEEKSNPETNLIVVKDEIYVVKDDNINENAVKNGESKANDSEVHITQSFANDAVVFQKEKPLIICVKSYGDYRYLEAKDILYFEADNNSTDIHLNNGEMVTAFKTLKHFENVLPNSDFLRIHNSYIININQVARIHTGNALCYIKESTVKLPFSKSYKENVDLIIQRIAGGNYLEI